MSVAGAVVLWCTREEEEEEEERYLQVHWIIMDGCMRAVKQPCVRGGFVFLMT